MVIPVAQPRRDYLKDTTCGSRISDYGAANVEECFQICYDDAACSYLDYNDRRQMCDIYKTGTDEHLAGAETYKLLRDEVVSGCERKVILNSTRMVSKAIPPIHDVQADLTVTSALLAEERETPVPRTGWEYFSETKMYYKLVNKEKRFDEARAFCQKKNGDLVSIQSEELNDLLIVVYANRKKEVVHSDTKGAESGERNNERVGVEEEGRHNPVQPGCEFVETYCKRATFPWTSIYHNNHNQILSKGNISKSMMSSKKSVILIVFDSVSHSNFIRSMPKSLEVLSSLYKSHIFKGMSKIGDNSFPNAVAFLSGKHHQTEFGDVMGYFDEHPLIWKDFEKAGYTTYYAEDYPKFNLFSYLAGGFRRKPVHHYFSNLGRTHVYCRPYWLNVYGSFLHRRSKFLCYGNQAMHNIELNYLSQFLRKNKDSPKFALNWLTELGHDYANTINVADEDFADFLRKHYDDLKESFFFVLSDHGHRFDPIRQTRIGRIEERFPFFSMHIPQCIQRKIPALAGVIQQNTEVLTSFWDFYVTMRDILDLGESDSWDQMISQLMDNSTWTHNYSKRGQSLLRPLSDRNCKEAGVPEEFCMCYPETAVDTNSYLITKLAQELILHLNRLLAEYNECAPLTLSKVRHATKIEDEFIGAEAKYRITVEATPSFAVFEALMRYNKAANTSVVHGNVNRVNSYGNQSICVHEQELRKYCYCTSTTAR
ncbi:hypothetical protein Y032_0205g1912 [Ancylostoma ceylanicum]|uniref:Apple domain-containing protein n=1 Tax=Ancylostoma ceylanicum TaxID=53326 RepID=A0A016SLG5_9BILA|nr:hypothetical protein Y032_0205g1912 [Ancylostoma ceylanicum]